MRDAHLAGDNKPIYINVHDLSVFNNLVWTFYPKAHPEGACGSYSWINSNNEIIAEAWLHRTKPGWNLRIKNYEEMKQKLCKS